MMSDFMISEVYIMTESVGSMSTGLRPYDAPYRATIPWYPSCRRSVGHNVYAVIKPGFRVSTTMKGRTVIQQRYA